MAWDCRTIWGDHQRYKDTYFSAFQELISPATVLYEVGYYRITGRVDDVVIVSGHNLGTPLRMPSMSIQQLPKVLLLVFHDIKGNALYGYVILKESGEIRNKENLFKEINQYISDHVGR
jgi:acetyl-CoA synthetase